MRLGVTSFKRVSPKNSFISFTMQVSFLAVPGALLGAECSLIYLSNKSPKVLSAVTGFSNHLPSAILVTTFASIFSASFLSFTFVDLCIRSPLWVKLIHQTRPLLKSPIVLLLSEALGRSDFPVIRVYLFPFYRRQLSSSGLSPMRLYRTF